MNYLFAAYACIWVLMGGYLFILGRRQSKLAKEIRFLQDWQRK